MIHVSGRLDGNYRHSWWKPTCRIGVLEFVLQRLPFALRERLDESQGLYIHVRLANKSRLESFGICIATYVLASDGVDHVVGWRAKELGDDRELVYMILSGE